MIFELFGTFARIGLFTFGGGYAMLPLIEHICVEKKQWITPDEMMEITVIAESTPGPVAINCSTYVGCKRAGLRGAAAATVGMVLPSFCIIFLISRFLDHFLEIAWVAHAFAGIKIAVGILILDAAFRLMKKMKRDAVSVTILVCAFLAMLLGDLFALRISSIALMLTAGAVTLCLSLVRGAAEGRRKAE